MSTPTVRLCHLYPREMNIYADRGNIAVLGARLRRRGLDLDLHEVGPGEAIPSAGADLLYLGGGQDRDQLAVAADLLATKAGAMRTLLGAGRRGRPCSSAAATSSPGTLRTAPPPAPPWRGSRSWTSRRRPPVRTGSSATSCCAADSGRRPANSSATRTMPGAPASATAPGRSGASPGATATTAATAPRALWRTAPSAPTCTARCCRRTPGWPTCCWAGRWSTAYSRPFELEPLDDRLEQAAHQAAVARTKHRRR